MLSYDYQRINFGSFPGDPNSDPIRVGAEKLDDNIEVTVSNFMELETRIMNLEAKSNKEIIATFDFSRECEYPYYGGLDDGETNWMVRYVNPGNPTILYANITDNPAMNTLAQAWANRSLLVYVTIAELRF